MCSVVWSLDEVHINVWLDQLFCCQLQTQHYCIQFKKMQQSSVTFQSSETICLLIGGKMRHFEVYHRLTPLQNMQRQILHREEGGKVAQNGEKHCEQPTGCTCAWEGWLVKFRKWRGRRDLESQLCSDWKFLFWNRETVCCSLSVPWNRQEFAFCHSKDYVWLWWQLGNGHYSLQDPPLFLSLCGEETLKSAREHYIAQMFEWQTGKLNFSLQL